MQVDKVPKNIRGRRYVICKPIRVDSYLNGHWEVTVAFQVMGTSLNLYQQGGRCWFRRSNRQPKMEDRP